MGFLNLCNTVEAEIFVEDLISFYLLAVNIMKIKSMTNFFTQVLTVAKRI